jgi:hypothetical protein
MLAFAGVPEPTNNGGVDHGAEAAMGGSAAAGRAMGRATASASSSCAAAQWRDDDEIAADTQARNHRGKLAGGTSQTRAWSQSQACTLSQPQSQSPSLSLSQPQRQRQLPAADPVPRRSTEAAASAEDAAARACVAGQQLHSAPCSETDSDGTGIEDSDSEDTIECDTTPRFV